MGIFDRFKGNTEDKPKAKPAAAAEPAKKPEVKAAKEEAKPAKAAEPAKTKPEDIKGKSQRADLVLVKPLITEKASTLGVLNKYVFSVNPKMNKIEIKKAVRAIYKVDPLAVNVANFSGKNVRYGRVYGRTKNWKKAIITLKPGDKIEIYEGV